MVLFGITGFKASGKSFVADIIRKKNIPIFDIDILCTELLSPGNVIHKKLITNIGYDIFDEFGNVDFLKLTKLFKVEPWIKTFVDEEIEEEINNFIYNLKLYLKGNQINIAGIESNSLINSKMKNYVDKIIFIKAPLCDRYKRLKQLYPQKIVDNILKIENDIDYSCAEYILLNDQSLSTMELKTNIDNILQTIQ